MDECTQGGANGWPVGSITPEEIREVGRGWKLAAITPQKRMEMVRKFFTFYVDAEWIEKSRARLVKMAPAKYEPTLHLPIRK